MKALLRIITIAVAIVAGTASMYSQEELLTPSGTFMFAERDTCQLFFDLYKAAPGSSTDIAGKEKPTVLFAFGGGFVGGSRDSKSYNRWFRMLTENGYNVVSIDYRLGLKDVQNPGVNMKFVRQLQHAIDIAVEDLFSATDYIIHNQEILGIDASNLVISGSSAGAITVMQGEWELCNRSEKARILPEDFQYAGVMSFAGAILSFHGKPTYDREPCPTLMLHGTADHVVPYKQIALFKLHFAGTKILTGIFRKNGYNYNTLRYLDNGHEIASSMVWNFNEEIRFLESNVINGGKRIVDALTDDPTIKKSSGSFKDLY